MPQSSSILDKIYIFWEFFRQECLDAKILNFFTGLVKIRGKKNLSGIGKYQLGY